MLCDTALGNSIMGALAEKADEDDETCGRADEDDVDEYDCLLAREGGLDDCRDQDSLKDT